MSANINLTPDVKAFIAEWYYRHPKWTAPMIQVRVSQLLHQKNPNLPEGWPGLSAIRKVLTEVKKKVSEPSLEDKPWSTATLDSYPIPPEALKAVLEVWKLRIDSEEWNFSFSIREAKWAARLSGLIKDTEELSTRANQYARAEILYQLIGHPFESSGLDKLIMGRFGEDAKKYTGELMDIGIFPPKNKTKKGGTQ